MKEQFIVAQNAFTVSADDGLSAWEGIKFRFRPFATSSFEKPVLEIGIKTMPLPQNEAETIYEPEHGTVGIISARVSRMPDGCLVMEFYHVSNHKTRLWMKMSPELNKAEIRLVPDGDDNVSYFLAHAMMIAYMLATAGNGTLLIHASAVVFNGRAYLFQGKSGTGKSTHARLWVQNIAGANLLNDDNPVIRFTADGTATAYGSPWSGKTPCYRNAFAPVGAFVRIVRAKENALHRLAPLNAYASLSTSVFFMPFLSDGLLEIRHKTVERLIGTVCCCEMHCRPDADAALTCMKAVSQKDRQR